MELDGNQKRIRALYSELQLEDQSRMPEFTHMWTRVRVIKDANRGVFGRPIAIAVSALVTFAACALAVWSWYQSAPATIPSVVIKSPQVTQVLAPDRPSPIRISDDLKPEKVQPRRHRNIPGQREADRRITTNAALISSWQSPTQELMASPTGLALNSLPQLNQSAKELESFLPKTNQVIKESNQ